MEVTVVTTTWILTTLVTVQVIGASLVLPSAGTSWSDRGASAYAVPALRGTTIPVAVMDGISVIAPVAIPSCGLCPDKLTLPPVT